VEFARTATWREVLPRLPLARSTADDAQHQWNCAQLLRLSGEIMGPVNSTDRYGFCAHSCPVPDMNIGPADRRFLFTLISTHPARSLAAGARVIHSPLTRSDLHRRFHLVASGQTHRLCRDFKSGQRAISSFIACSAAFIWVRMAGLTRGTTGKKNRYISDAFPRTDAPPYLVPNCASPSTQWINRMFARWQGSKPSLVSHLAPSISRFRTVACGCSSPCSTSCQRLDPARTSRRAAASSEKR